MQFIWSAARVGYPDSLAPRAQSRSRAILRESGLDDRDIEMLVSTGIVAAA